MGFYFELHRGKAREYAEGPVPPVFWLLYAFAGFALACMGGAAHALLGDLARIGSSWDRAIVGLILSFVPFYLLVGLKLAGMRKYVSFEGDSLRKGFRLFGVRLWELRIPRATVREITLVNRRPAPNIAPSQHADAQYYIRGHWRVVAERTEGRGVVLDKNVEKGALEPMFEELRRWLA